jgi:hypothetical protein
MVNALHAIVDINWLTVHALYQHSTIQLMTRIQLLKIQIVKQIMETEHVLVAVHTTYFIVMIVRLQEKIHSVQNLMLTALVLNVTLVMSWISIIFVKNKVKEAILPIAWHLKIVLSVIKLNA